MKRLRDQRGIALITAVLLSLISLAMVLSVIYFVMQGSKISAIQKKYQTALEASHGAAEIVTKTVIPNAITLSADDLGSTKEYSIADFKADYAGLGMEVPTTAACLFDKLRKSTTLWAPGCSSTLDVGPSVYDMKFILEAVAPQPDFDVYVKIVDTIKGNSNTSGINLEGLGVVESGSGLVVPMHRPYLYRMEVQAERQSKEERANLTVLYGF
ncbi:MAG: hypothetical protein ACM3ON_03940 [Chloroflexota bacterium]